MKDNRLPKEDERLTALLGLAASKPEPVEKCPEAEVLAAFIDNRLSSSRRQQVMAHLNQCERCYQEWLQVALSLEETRPAETLVRKPSWWHWLRERLHPRPWLFPLTAAVAVTIAVAVVLVQKPQVPDWQPQQLAALVQKYADTEKALALLPRTGAATFAFSDAATDPARHAFAAGFREAQSWLAASEQRADVKTWQQSHWRDYYHFGQWTLLTWVLAQSPEVTSQEWYTFARHCQELIVRFQNRPQELTRERALTALQELHALLDTLAGNGSPADQVCLTRKLRLTIRQWLG